MRGLFILLLKATLKCLQPMSMQCWTKGWASKNLQYRLSNISSFSDKLRTLNHQSQLTVSGWWSCVCPWFYQSWLPWQVVAFKIVLKGLRVQRKTDVWRTSRRCHVHFFKDGLPLAACDANKNRASVLRLSCTRRLPCERQQYLFCSCCFGD